MVYDLEKTKKWVEEHKSIMVLNAYPDNQSVSEVKSDGFIVKEDGIHLGNYVFKAEEYGNQWYLNYSEFSDDLNDYYRYWGSLD